VLNGRIYRAAFVPLLFVLVIAGFSLTGRTAPLTSNLVPDAFNGARAFAELEDLAARFPDRRPGGVGDRQLAGYVAQTLRGLGGTAKGGFSVSTRSVRAQTIDGARTLTTVIAQRPGTTGEEPIVILAHRDAASRAQARGDGLAQLSGTAALLELARVLAASETQRTIVLVSTSGGSGGDGGAADFAAHASELAGGPIDAALVLGDLAGERPHAPLTASFSASGGAAPALLQSTVSAAIAQQAGLGGGGLNPPGTLAQLAHLVFPLTTGEQGPLGAHGLPAMLIGVGGEQAPPASEPVSAARLEALGRAALSAVYALDSGPEVLDSEANGSRGAETGLQIQHKTIPAWALRLVVAALLLPALLVLGDGLARIRRQRWSLSGRPAGRWMLWALACALPFLACALFAILLGRLGAIPAPYPPVAPAALPFDAHAQEAVLATALVLALAWLGWPPLMRVLGLPVRPRVDVAGVGVLLVLASLAVVVWVLDPLTALLLVPALHLWLVFVSPPPGSGARELGGDRMQALALVGLGVVPLALLVVFYAGQLDLGPGGVLHTALLLLAGGRIGVVGVLLWSVAFGCLAAALLLALALPSGGGADGGEPEDGIGRHEPITMRGPLSYAGPGSLGGTESALGRRG
jgi:Peptidase family M28